MWYQRAFRIMLIFFVFLPVLPAFAQPAVEAEGCARIEPDINISRELAILRAKQQALETLGIGISSKNISVQGKMLDEMIMVQTSGFVERHSVLEEGPKNGYYHVRLRAWVKTGKALDEAYGSVFRERILSISAKGQGSEHIERLIRKGLSGSFYHILDHGHKTLRPDYQIVIDSSVKHHADFAGFRSFYAGAGISMVQVSASRQVIYVAPDKPTIVYGKDLDQALSGMTVNQYPKKVAEPLVNSFRNRLTSLEKKRSRTIRITISGLPDLKAFRAFRDYVKNIRLGMEELFNEDYSNGKSILYVSYREKSLYLATIIGYRSQYEIIGHQWDSIQVAYTEDPSEKACDVWKASQNDLQENWKSLKFQIESELDEHEKRQKEEWNRLKAEVEQKWKKFIHSTKKDWVEYNKQMDARSIVDFEHGKVVLETIIPADDPSAMKKARGKIKEQVRKIFSRESFAKERLLKDQVVNNKGKAIDPDNIEQYAREEALPRLTADPSAFQSADGIKRRKYSVTISMVPNHIRVRAEKYLPFVRKNAARFRLNPQLILAIIHTESYFNPLAISSCNAVGLMQIIPRYAGREAYRFVYKRDTVITPEYLNNPENNIELGCAYLHLLKYKHFNDVGGKLKNRYISICGYNWGPTSVRRKIVDRYPIGVMSNREVYMLLRRKTPHETKEYIKRVMERMCIYDFET